MANDNNLDDVNASLRSESAKESNFNNDALAFSQEVRKKLDEIKKSKLDDAPSKASQNDDSKTIQIEPVNQEKTALNKNDFIDKTFDPGKKTNPKYDSAKAETRMDELRKNPIEGKLDADHIKRINQYILQDSPELKGGEYRPEAESQLRDRKVYGKEGTYKHQFMEGVVNDATMNKFMKDFGSIDDFKQANHKQAVEKLSKLYADIDNAGAFRHGNNKTARIFVEQVADKAGYDVDWSKINAHSMNIKAEKKVATLEVSAKDKQNDYQSQNKQTPYAKGKLEVTKANDMANKLQKTNQAQQTKVQASPTPKKEMVAAR